MNKMVDMLGRWQLDMKKVREQMYHAPTPRERERWHAIWLLARGESVEAVADALERDVRTIIDWQAAFAQEGPVGMSFEQSGGAPPSSAGRNKRN